METVVDASEIKEEIVTIMDKYKEQSGESYIEFNHISNGLHTTSEEPKSDELSTQSIIQLHTDPVQESEPVNCDMKASLTKRSNDNDPLIELLEDGESMYIKNKRVKITEPSNSNIKMEEANSAFLDLQHTTENNSLDQKIEYKGVSPCFSGRTSENMEIAVDGTSTEVVEKPSKCLTLSPAKASQVAGGSVNMVVDRAFAGGKKLLVLDVNGLLVDISPYIPYDYYPDEILVKKAIFKRPYCDDFLKFCFERFNVGVWSSRRKQNIEPILDFIFGNDKAKLLFHWDQSYCTNSGSYTVEKRNKPLILKKLRKLWDKCEPDLPWEKGVFNESNTLLIDDSPYKAICNPQHTAIFPFTYHFRNVKDDNSLGPGGALRVYLEGLEMAENVQEYVKQNPFGQRAITEKNLSWLFYLKIIEANSSPPQQNAGN